MKVDNLAINSKASGCEIVVYDLNEVEQERVRIVRNALRRTWPRVITWKEF